MTTQQAEQFAVPPGPVEGSGRLGPIPEKVREKWRKIYAERMKAELEEEPDREIAMRRENVAVRHRNALRAANKLLRVPDCTCYADAKALEDWQVIHRSEEGGVLKVVTVDAKKYKFPVPSQPTSGV